MMRSEEFFLMPNKETCFLLDYFEIPRLSTLEFDAIQNKVHAAAARAITMIKTQGNKIITYVVHDSELDFDDYEGVLFIKSIDTIVKDRLIRGIKVNMDLGNHNRLSEFLQVLDPFNHESRGTKSYLESVAEILKGYEKISDIMEKRDITDFFHERILGGVYYPYLRVNFYETTSAFLKQKIQDCRTVELTLLELEDEDRRCLVNYEMKIKGFLNWFKVDKLNRSSYKRWNLVGEALVLRDYALGLCELPASVPKFKFHPLYEIQCRDLEDNVFGSKDNHWLFISLQFDNIMSAK